MKYSQIVRMNNCDLANHYHDICAYSDAEAVKLRKDYEGIILSRFIETYSEMYRSSVEEIGEEIPGYCKLLQLLDAMDENKQRLVYEYANGLMPD